MKWIDTLCHISRAQHELSYYLTTIVYYIIDKRYDFNNTIRIHGNVNSYVNFIIHYKCPYKKLILSTILKSIRIKYVSYWGEIRNAKEDKGFLGILYNLIDMLSDDHTQDEEVIEYLSGISSQHHIFEIDVMPNTIPFIVKEHKD